MIFHFHVRSLKETVRALYSAIIPETDEIFHDTLRRVQENVLIFYLNV